MKIFQFTNDYFVGDAIAAMSDGMSDVSDEVYEDLSKCFYDADKYKMSLTTDEENICIVFIEKD